MDESIRWEQCIQCFEWFPYELMRWNEEDNTWMCDTCYSGVPIIW